MFNFIFLVLFFIPRFHAVSICATGSKLFATITKCPQNSTEFYGAGANIFDAFWDGSSGMIQPGISYQDTLLALQSASSSGIRFFRFFAGCWGPKQIFWLTNQQQYWNEFDRLMNDITEMEFYVIPSLGYDNWDLVANQWVQGLNETKNDLVKNTSSYSFRLAAEYFSQFASRYATSDNILFWELGNELNLLVNLPPPWCGDQQCFNTSEMNVFTSALADILHQKDSKRRPIASGFSAPRPTAWHQENCALKEEDVNSFLPSIEGTFAAAAALRRNPNFSQSDVNSGCEYWGLDSEDQFQEILAKQHEGLEIITIHHYGSPTNCYFTPTNCANASLAILAADVAMKEQKILFVGEYGGASPTFTGPTDSEQAFDVNMLNLQVENRKSFGSFRLSAIWAWECPSHRGDMNCIYPNSTRPTEAGSNKMVKYLQQANAALFS